jgi:hypothetical protein
MRTLHRTMTMNNQATTRNVLIFEYVTGGGFSIENVPKSLANEGKMMVEALLANFMALPFMNVSVLKKNDTVPIEDNFKMQIQEVDAVWVIAPEFDGILETYDCEQNDDPDPNRKNKHLFLYLNNHAFDFDKIRKRVKHQ